MQQCFAVSGMMLILLLTFTMGQFQQGDLGGDVGVGGIGWGGASDRLPTGTTWEAPAAVVEPLADAGSEEAEMALHEPVTPSMLFEAAGQALYCACLN